MNKTCFSQTTGHMADYFQAPLNDLGLSSGCSHRDLLMNSKTCVHPWAQLLILA